MSLEIIHPLSFSRVFELLLFSLRWWLLKSRVYILGICVFELFSNMLYLKVNISRTRLPWGITEELPRDLPKNGNKIIFLRVSFHRWDDWRHLAWNDFGGSTPALTVNPVVTLSPLTINIVWSAPAVNVHPKLTHLYGSFDCFFIQSAICKYLLFIENTQHVERVILLIFITSLDYTIWKNQLCSPCSLPQCCFLSVGSLWLCVFNSWNIFTTEAHSIHLFSWENLMTPWSDLNRCSSFKETSKLQLLWWLHP